MHPQSQISILIFRNRNRRFGLMLNNIREVLPAFALTTAPGIADLYSGLISLRGEVLPVLDVAHLSGDESTVLRPQHQFVIAQTASQTVAVLVEDVMDLVERNDDDLAKREFLDSGLSGIHGVFMHEGEMVLLLDLEALVGNSASAQAASAIGKTGAAEIGSVL